MSSDNIIEIKALSKCYQIYDHPSDRLKQMLFRGRRQYYKEFWALQDISLNIRKGETVGIIGRNGSGKSTLLQIICGTLNPTQGTVKINGRVAALLELGAGFNPEFSGVENVYMAASLYGLTHEQITERFDAISTFADIGEHIYQPVKTYSSGMYVRLAFAVIAHVDADILVIDEALAVGDAFFTQKCMRFLRNFMEKGTVLFVSHDTGAVVNLCDSVIWLNQGQTKSQGDPKRISEDYLASFYEAPAIGQKSLKEVTDIANNTPDLVQNDARWPRINASTLCNQLEIFKFNPNQSHAFGHGSALIEEVHIEDIEGNGILQCIGGEIVELKIFIRALAQLEQPIVGFSFKDRLGQVLFGDNTYITYQEHPLRIEEGVCFIARFRFQMPILPQGEYSISTAIATGTQIDHQQQHWVHDALIIRSLSSSVSTGLVGVPMHLISIENLEKK